MSVLEEKIDIMARILLGETDAKSELKILLDKSRKRSRTELIHEAMKELGVPYGNYGHDYLVEAVGMVIDNPKFIHNATRSHGLYQVVAEKVNSTPSRVSRAIRHSIESMWERGDLDVLQHHFGNTIDPNKCKPTNTEAIACIASIVRFRMEQGG